MSLPLFMSSVMDFGVDPSICWLFTVAAGMNRMFELFEEDFVVF